MAFDTFLVTSDSKKVGPGSVFVAIQGTRDNGERYIPEALSRGAQEIIVVHGAQLDPTTIQLCAQNRVTISRVPDIRKALAERAAQAYGHPARSLRCIGITGTKGKTTTAWLLQHILQEAGYRVALLSTVENRIEGERYVTQLTTQQPDYIQAFLRECVNRGVTDVIIEVAAQALTQHRVAHISFNAAAWLNFSQEHGEFYATMQDYWDAKAQLLNQIIPGGTIILPSDEQFEKLSIPPQVRKICWNTTDIVPEEPALHSPSIACRVGTTTYRCPQLLGMHNGANLLVSTLLAQHAGVAPEACQHALKSFTGIPGRLNWYPLHNGARVCIDYAHNPASFEATLSSLRACTDHLIVVFGAGGDRDAARRPIMGAIAAQYADAIFLTSDNPRSEHPQDICNDIFAGIATIFRTKVTQELDRERAIRRACSLSQRGAIVALLGKGPDEYQLVHGTKTFFSERMIVQSLS